MKLGATWDEALVVANPDAYAIMHVGMFDVAGLASISDKEMAAPSLRETMIRYPHVMD